MAYIWVSDGYPKFPRISMGNTSFFGMGDEGRSRGTPTERNKQHINRFKWFPPRLHFPSLWTSIEVLCTRIAVSHYISCLKVSGQPSHDLHTYSSIGKPFSWCCYSWHSVIKLFFYIAVKHVVLKLLLKMDW